MEEVMLHIKIDHSLLRSQLHWCVDMSLNGGICHRLAAPNGAGKTSFLEELKLHWPRLFPTTLLGFTDQAPLEPFQDLTVEAVMDVLWDITRHRHVQADWRTFAWWQESAVKSWWPRKVSQLSGGENQWVKILMMRSLECDVWIMDEPFQSLDQKRQTELWSLLQDWLTTGKYLLLVHHGDVPLHPQESWTLTPAVTGLSWARLS
jgi:manganese/zinc/iron transport system ATP- binding protein